MEPKGEGWMFCLEVMTPTRLSAPEHIRSDDCTELSVMIVVEQGFY